jgi:hypothetical protein
MGKLTILEGHPGLGKSTLLAELAARVTRGQEFSGIEIYEPGAVVLLSAEDGLADTVRPRLDAAGADCGNVLVLDGYKSSSGVFGQITIGDPRNPAGLAVLEEVIRREGAQLVCIDVLAAYLSGSRDTHRDHDIRQALRPLADLAESTGCAIVAVRHLRKDASGSALAAGGGSIGFAGVARSLLLLDRDPDQLGRLVLAVVKSNLAERAASLLFRLEPSSNGAACVRWLGKSEHTADSLTAARAAPRLDSDEKSKVEECADYLRDWLVDGPLDRREVLQLAKEHRFSESVLDRAAGMLGVTKRKSGYSKAKRSEWSLSPFPSAESIPVNPQGLREMDPGDGNGETTQAGTSPVEPL